MKTKTKPANTPMVLTTVDSMIGALKTKPVQTIDFDDLCFMTLNDLSTMSTKIATEHGWTAKTRKARIKGIPEKIALMHSELSEALEEYRNGRSPDQVYYNPDKPDKPEGIPVELADVLIRVFNLCGELGIDIARAVKLKTAYNRTRPFRHGGKKC
jgi:NTP pyrophosphatase (non-canonical NTP hydrolase)